MAMKNSECTVAEVLRRGGFPHVIDGAKTLSKADALTEISQEMKFPEWFGHNLDALYDCLTDLSWLPAGEHVLIWTGSDQLKQADPKAYLGIHSVLFDAQRALKPLADSSNSSSSRQFTVVLVDS
jgi:RNAse (barnase) inhibitor barstar